MNAEGTKWNKEGGHKGPEVGGEETTEPCRQGWTRHDSPQQAKVWDHLKPKFLKCILHIYVRVWVPCGTREENERICLTLLVKDICTFPKLPDPHYPIWNRRESSCPEGNSQKTQVHCAELSLRGVLVNTIFFLPLYYQPCSRTRRLRILRATWLADWLLICLWVKAVSCLVSTPNEESQGVS